MATETTRTETEEEKKARLARESASTKPTTGAQAKTPREALLREREARPIVSVEAHLAHNIDEPFPVAEPKKLTEREQKLAKESKERLEKIGKILESFGGNETAVPHNHEYWTLVAQQRQVE